MELKEIYQDYIASPDRRFLYNQPKISFEVFPPKDGNISDIFEQVRILKKYHPVLISLTYGANGGTKDMSFELLKTFLDLELNVMPHFTCVGSTRELIEHYITQIENMGIENILALRGDKTEATPECEFNYANELVEFIHEHSTLSIGVAGYPECHIECENIHKDIENLKRKVDMGASAIFTQLFFENDKLYRYIELVKNAGIDLPIVAGILPIRSRKQVEKMVSLTHAKIPNKIQEQLVKFPNDAKKIGVEFAINQCHDLLDNKVDGLHFFTLNHSDQVSEILDNIL